MNNILTFELIQEYYKKGYYTNYHLKELCKVGFITETEYYKLTGKMYWEDTN